MSVIQPFSIFNIISTMKKPVAVLRYLLSVHILALIILALFRLALYLANIGQAEGVENKGELLFRAMLKGVRFDNMVSCYIIILPAVVLLILSLFDKISKTVVKGFNIYFIVLYSIIFAVSAADIPYFSYFFTHMGGSIVNWLGFEGTAGMILQESSYYIYFGIFLVLTILFGISVFHFGRILTRTETTDLKKTNYKLYIPLSTIVLGLCFIGMRGGLERYPLRTSGAYFSSNTFFNQLGINPAFFLMKSYSSFKKQKDKLKGTIDEKDAIAYVQKSYGVTPLAGNANPISRKIEPDGNPVNANVVIILMESLSSEFLQIDYKGKSITPYIHELIGKSYYFENFYSAGIHTNNGIASTLYGYPPIFERTMMAVESDHYTGLPVTLKKNGYETLFFLTSNPQYDNMYSFLNDNGFDHIYSQYDYPSDKIVNNFGVQDDYLYEFGLDKLNKAAESGKPFLATFMTVSNHPPFIVPDRFKDAGSNDEECIVAFTDNSLREFMENAAKQEWYDNTIFVVLGDHGRVIGQQIYEMPLGYNHIPLIVYSPLFEDTPKQVYNFGGQIDIFPTVMGLLNRPYVNNSLGTDLLKSERPYMFFVSDNFLGCIDNEYFYIYNPAAKTDALFDYRNRGTTDLRQEHSALADSMKVYGISMTMAADYLVKNKLTVPE